MNQIKPVEAPARRPANRAATLMAARAWHSYAGGR